jgi:hypothetical protein
LPAGPDALPDVKLSEGGARAAFAQLRAALGVEFRLLRAERSLVVVAPLVVFVCALELAAYGVNPEGSYSAAYASRTAGSLLMFLFGVAVFYAGETMQRDRELRVEPLLWSAPAPDSALLLSKLAATFLLSASLVAAVGFAAACVQLTRGHGPLELSAYLKTYALVTLPCALFMCAASVALNLLLRDKHLAYAVSLAAAGAVYYLSSRGFDTWLYNPALYNLWAPADLARGGGRLTLILVQRGYTLSLAALLLALGFLFFERRSDGGASARRLTTGRRRALLAAAAALLAAVLSGLSVNDLK